MKLIKFLYNPFLLLYSLLLPFIFLLINTIIVISFLTYPKTPCPTTPPCDICTPRPCPINPEINFSVSALLFVVLILLLISKYYLYYFAEKFINLQDIKLSLKVSSFMNYFVLSLGGIGFFLSPTYGFRIEQQIPMIGDISTVITDYQFLTIFLLSILPLIGINLYIQKNLTKS